MHFSSKVSQAITRMLVGALNLTQEISLRAGTQARRWWKMRRSQKQKAQFPSFTRQLISDDLRPCSKRSTVEIHVWNSHVSPFLSLFIPMPDSKKLYFEQHQKCCLETDFPRTYKEQSDRPEESVDGNEAKPLMSWASWCTTGSHIQMNHREFSANVL